MAKRATRLKNLMVSEGSLVDRGANYRALVKLHKRDENPEDNRSLVNRIVDAVTKALGLKGDEMFEDAKKDINQDTSLEDGKVDKHFGEQTTKSESFVDVLSDKKNEAKYDQVCGEIWDYIWALEKAIESIIRDETNPNREALIRGSIDQFQASVETAMPNWLSGNRTIQKIGRKIAGDRLQRLKDAHGCLAAIIQEAEKEEEGDPNMKINKSALPADVVAYIEDLEKKAGGTETPPIDDINKAELPEPVRKRLEDLESKVAKAEKEADERKTVEYVAKAEKLGLPGVEAAEMGKVLKSLSEKDPEAYATVEKALTASAAAIAKSATFEEIGKSGSDNTGDAYAQIVAKANDIRKSDPSLTQSQAIAKAFNENPELAKRYAEER
jgi:uncharacterized membrane protein